MFCFYVYSCTVKNPSEDTFRNEIQSGLDSGKHVVVAGCVPQGAPKSEYLKGLSIVGVQQIDRVVEVVEETLKGHSVRLLQQKKSDGKRVAGAALSLPKIRKNPLIEIIAINTGCLNQCTYCKTKHARGDLVSYPAKEIVERAKQAFEEGVCEIWLTSEDTGELYTSFIVVAVILIIIFIGFRHLRSRHWYIAARTSMAACRSHPQRLHDARWYDQSALHPRTSRRNRSDIGHTKGLQLPARPSAERQRFGSRWNEARIQLQGIRAGGRCPSNQGSWCHNCNGHHMWLSHRNRSRLRGDNDPVC